MNTKKIIATALLGGALLAGASAKTIVVYFSATGNTERLSKTVAEALDADIHEIEPAQPYTSADLNWNDRSSRSTVECNDPKSRPAIANSVDLSSYDTVIVAFPIWWYDAPKIIYTFVESVDLSGKKVVPICTSGGSGLGRSGENLAAVSSSGAQWLRGTRFNSRASAQEVKRFFDGVLK